MPYTGALLYVLLAGIVLLFWRESRGQSLSDLLDQDIHSHHLVQKVLAKHPHGGTWRQYRQWLAEAQKPQPQ